VRFLLVDSIVELEPGLGAVGLKNVAMSEDFLADHFPERPIMPGALILEALVQLADWVIRDATSFEKIGIVTAFDRIKFRRVTRPGDQLRLEVSLTGSENGSHAFKAKAYTDGAVAASADLTLVEAPLADYLDADGARASLALLRREDNA
jgi:3-hydroxyacyl-[acyl-carrier-protein] dehydratase